MICWSDPWSTPLASFYVGGFARRRNYRGWVSPRFVSPDYSAVRKTYKRHPKAQCRLDFLGTFCLTEFDKMKISGKTVSGHFEFLFIANDEGVRPELNVSRIQTQIQSMRNSTPAVKSKSYHLVIIRNIN